jgi:hypothetical protein
LAQQGEVVADAQCSMPLPSWKRTMWTWRKAKGRLVGPGP